MDQTLILLATGLLLNVFHKFDGKLNVIPRDTEVMINDSTYMNCSTSLEAEKVHWHHGNKPVYKGSGIIEPYDGRFTVEINSSTGANNLVIRSVQPSDAGLYQCLEDETVGEGKSAQLIVLDDDPVCKSNMHPSGVFGPNTCGIEQDELKLSCSVTYHGNTFPILQWKANGNNQSIIEGLSSFTSSKNVTYTLTKKGTLDLNNSSFICQTTRTSNRNYSCSSDVIKILYIFSNKLTINMTIDDEVTCFANTSQLCSYKWKWYSGYDWIAVSNDQTLKSNKVGLHRCEATCSIGNKSCTEESMYAEVYSIVVTSGQNQLVLLVLIAVPVIVIISVVIYLRIRTPKLEDIPVETLEVEVERKREQERQRLIDALPEKYKADPTCVQTIGTKAAGEGKKVIKGLTILDKELFVVREWSSEVEVYSLMNYDFSRRWKFMDLIDPNDLVSCNRNTCLYLSDKKGDDKSNEILRVDLNGELIKKWSTGKVYGRLSVTDESNVILAVFLQNKLNEYSPDGKLIREINLSGSDIHHPLHAVKLTSGHFVVSHGYEPDDRHRVCIVDADGNLKKLFGGKCGPGDRELDLPIYLAVDGDGFVMVADRWNNRVLLLDSDLEFKREIRLNEKYRFRVPSRITLDQTNGRLFVAGNENQSILILEFTK